MVIELTDSFGQHLKGSDASDPFHDYSYFRISFLYYLALSLPLTVMHRYQ